LTKLSFEIMKAVLRVLFGSNPMCFYFAVLFHCQSAKAIFWVILANIKFRLLGGASQLVEYESLNFRFPRLLHIYQRDNLEARNRSLRQF
ncbi:hypothetical protein, partial [Enterobacter cloacae complex sp. 2DZ2F20B]|uniref:hypothetical protein n=1 Tax=Enterobacter cloacae complex sp. 2DZ2F20B TaxID=2511993 RepID=UPI001CA5496B